MIEIILWIVIFIASLFILIKSANHFTNSAEKIGIHFGIPAFIVGVTIVSIGTSLPELLTSIIAVLQGASEIVISDVVGSNITNIFLVLGITAIVGKKLIIKYDIAKIDLPLLVGSTFLLALCAWDGAFTLVETILCLLAFLVYILYTIHVEKKHPDKEIKKELKTELRKRKLETKTWLILIFTAVLIYIGSKFTVDSIIKLSELLSIGTEIIAITAVALGTSLPELVVSVTAAAKGKPEIAVGNVLGSNIFNALGVMGIAGIFGTLIIPSNIISFGIPMIIIATFLYVFMTQDKLVSKWEGWLLILFYVFFIGKLFGLF